MYPVTTSMTTALADPAKRRGFLLEFSFANGARRIGSFSATKVWNGYAWEGVADFRLTGSFSQSIDSPLQNITLAIATEDPTWIDQFLNQSKGRLFRWWCAYLDVDGNVIDAPIQRPTLRMTPGRISSSATNKFASLVLEDMFNQSRKRAPRTRSHADQKTLFAPPYGEPNDECFYDVSNRIIGGTSTATISFRQHY